MSALRHIDEISVREFRLAILVCLVIAALNALYFAFRIGYFAGYDAGAYGCHVPAPQDYSPDIMRLKIELALLVIAIVLRFRRVIGFLISVLATLFIELQYALWYLDTKRWLREMNVSDFSQLPVPSEWPNFGGIYRATPWDFVILGFATLLVVWQVRVLITLITSARHHKQPT